MKCCPFGRDPIILLQPLLAPSHPIKHRQPFCSSLTWTFRAALVLTIKLQHTPARKFWTLSDICLFAARKFFPITFFGSIIWIALYSYLMVWWATVTGNTIGIPPEVKHFFRWWWSRRKGGDAILPLEVKWLKTCGVSDGRGLRRNLPICFNGP